MIDINAQLLSELAHSRIDDQVRAASRAAVLGSRGRRAARGRPRHRFPLARG